MPLNEEQEGYGTLKPESDEVVLELADIAAPPVLFSKRLKGDTLYFKNADGTDAQVVIEPMRWIQYQVASAEGDGSLAYWLLRCGIKDFHNLKDADGNAVNVKFIKARLAGRVIDVLEDDVIDCLHAAMQDKTAIEILELTTAQIREHERVGFTKGSELSAGNGALGAH